MVSFFFPPWEGPKKIQTCDAQTLLADFAGLGSLAAATALNAGETPEVALQLLEHGRGVIAGLMMDMRSDISHLQLRHPTLANQFQLLRDELNAPASLTETVATEKATPKEQQVQRRREAEREFSSVVEAVWAQPEFANFLQPPATEDMTAEASRGLGFREPVTDDGDWPQDLCPQLQLTLIQPLRQKEHILAILEHLPMCKLPQRHRQVSVSICKLVSFSSCQDGGVGTTPFPIRISRYMTGSTITTFCLIALLVPLLLQVFKARASTRPP